jgi:lactobin A/cerein 7B family class IIb bacteriocin
MENKFEMNKFAMVSDAKLQEVDGGVVPILIAGLVGGYVIGRLTKK